MLNSESELTMKIGAPLELQQAAGNNKVGVSLVSSRKYIC